MKRIEQAKQRENANTRFYPCSPQIVATSTPQGRSLLMYLFLNLHHSYSFNSFNTIQYNETPIHIYKVSKEMKRRAIGGKQ